MPLRPGARLGPYTVKELVGSGGMGEVYRASDPRLGRDVAIKVIGSAVGGMPEMRRRFDEEARIAARLDHPRICAVHDVGHDAGLDYLVMEFLEGESLGSRLRRGPIPLPELLGYAIEIASALAYAHAHHVVHRDIKPGNIFLTRGGVKVVDFGLAKLRQLEQAPSPMTGPAETLRLATVPGVVHGTPEYMPPERLEGQEMDYRGDIFAFGVVVYEMATARRAFDASTPAALITAIMSSEPPPMVGHGTATPELEWLVRRCLIKNPAARWQSMRDMETILKWMASRAGPPDRRPPPSRWTRVARNAAAAAGVALLGALVWVAARSVYHRPDGPPPTVAAAVTPPPGGRFTLTDGSVNSAQVAVSPDGQSIAFVATGANGVSQIWLRRIDSLEAIPLAGTTDAVYPFWAPDSRSLGFFADRQLKRVDLAGGPSRRITDAANGRGGTWNAADVIVFAPTTTGTLARVNADGSGRASLTALAPQGGDLSHRWPQFLPDGRHFVFFSRSGEDGKDGVSLASLDETGSALLVETRLAGVYAPPGRLLYVAEGTLMVRDLDVANRRLTGSPIPVVQGVGGSSNFYGAFSVSTNGVLAYAGSSMAAELAWVDREGHLLETVAPRGGYVDFQLSHDGRYVAAAEVDPHNGFPDVHVIDLVRGGGDRRITSSRSTVASPVWSWDGTRLAFRSNRNRVHDLYVVTPGSSGGDRLLYTSESAKYPTDWSGDGRLVYHSITGATGWDIWAAPATPEGQPLPLVRTSDDEVQGKISPDGRWLAYTWFTSTDRSDVSVRALDGTDRYEDISVNGGSDPHWAADGSELFYIAADSMLMSVPVQTRGALRPGTPKALFRIAGMRMTTPYPSRYDVDASGRRLLVQIPLEDPQTAAINVLVNWTARRAAR